MRTRMEPRRNGKIPPLLEIDEDGYPVVSLSLHEGRAWSSDEDDPSLQTMDFPADLDD